MYLIYSNYSNIVVIKYYLDIIKEALECNGEQVGYVDTLKGVDRSSTLIIPYSVDAALAYLKGFRKIIVWEQGLPAEESYMRNKSMFRRFLYDKAIKFGLKRAKFYFFVSDAMKQYLSHKYNITFGDNCFIMPCFNTGFHPESFEAERKYERMIFTYIGSLAVWQCFEETLELYEKIEEELKECQLRVYTFSVDEAVDRIQKKKIKNFQVECVDNEELPQKLKDASFGFVIRSSDIVNKVATPTKLSSYLSCGVIPIFSDSLSSFFELSKAMKYAIPLSGSDKDADRVVEFCRKAIDINDVKKEYEAVFEYYYSKKRYIAEINKALIHLKG